MQPLENGAGLCIMEACSAIVENKIVPSVAVRMGLEGVRERETGAV